MQKTTTADKITKKFLEYLSDQDLSKKSLKNYKSDISHFSGWLMFKIRSWGVSTEKLSEAVHFISQKTAKEYLGYLTQNGIPEKTINRRLSTLRHLGRFLLHSQVLDFNFMEDISNVSYNDEEDTEHKLVVEFEEHLKTEDISKNTIKNYKSDIRQFIEWLEQKGKKESLAN